MPNWPMSDTLRWHLTSRVNTVAQRPLNQVLSMFPLSTDEVQDMLIEPKHLAQMRELHQAGIKTITTWEYVRVAFIRDKIPELKRGIVLYLQMPRKMSPKLFLKYATMLGVATTKWNEGDDAYVVPNLEVLNDDKRMDLMQWLNDALMKTRLHEAATMLSQEVLGWAPTAMHLQSAWPLLCTLVSPSTAYHDRPLVVWKERFRNPVTRNLKAYRPAYDSGNFRGADEQARIDHMRKIWPKVERLIPVAERIIHDGLLIGETVTRDQQTEICARVEHWERLENDARFPIEADGE
jgi:hypothetical protein